MENNIPAETKENEKDTTRKTDVLARVLGFIIIVVGFGILAFDFYLAYKLYNTPVSGYVIGGSGDSQSGSLAGAWSTVISRFIFLVVMTIIGSIVTNRGLHLFLSAFCRSK